MVLFLQIVAGFIVALVLCVLAALWWVKRWIRRAVDNAAASTALLDPRLARPARIFLERCAEGEPGEALSELWRQYHDLGFRLLGDYTEREGSFTLARFARHPELKLALTLIEESDEKVEGTVWAMTEDKRLLAWGSGSEISLVSDMVHWIAWEDLPPERCFAEMCEAVQEKTLREPNASLLRNVWERMYALHADAEIAGGVPSREEVQARVTTLSPQADAATVDGVYEISRSQWRTRMEAAVLDHWRRASRLDAVLWQRLDGRIHVIDASLSADEITERLPSVENAEALMTQLQEQGFTGINLYEEIQKRLPASCRYTRLGEVRRPVHALLYGDDGGAAEEESSGKGALPYGYRAIDEQGREETGSIFATDSADAHRQLRALGRQDVHLLTEPSAGGQVAEVFFNPAIAAEAVRAVQAPITASLLRSLRANMWIWLPPLILLFFSLSSAGQADWRDWLIYAYAGFALAFTAGTVAPMLLFYQYQRARIFGRWKRAMLYLSLLEKVNWIGGLKSFQLVAERCKILAAAGQEDQAVTLWSKQEKDVDPEVYYSELGQIYEAGGRSEKQLAAQRQLYEISATRELPTIDLALSLIRYRRVADESEALIGRLQSSHLSELALGGYHLVRGMILADRQQYSHALNQYRQAAEQLQQYAKAMPLILGLLAEVNGYVALALRATGKEQLAGEVWESVAPILRVHASTRLLVERYESGVDGRPPEAGCTL